MGLSSGTKFGPYEIVSPLGAGGMGEVYRCRDTRLDRTVAVKVLPEHLSSNGELQQRFEREARAISQLQHPHICVLYDVGSQNGTSYLVMEYLEGETLAERLRKGPLAPEQLLKIAIEVADALDKAHHSGIIHRDLKPGNVMLTKGGAKLMDFGLARALTLPVSAAASAHSSLPSFTATPTVSHTASPLTSEGSILGTLNYMSPEQIEGKEADTRSDIFAFGCLLYEMATGKRAFEGRSHISVASAILDKEPEPVRSTSPATPEALDHVVRVCLAKQPEERFQCAHDLKLQLQWIAQSGSAPLINTKSGRSIWSTIAWSSVALLLLGAVALGLLLIQTQTELAGHTQPVKSSILAAPGVMLHPVPVAVISPDGRRIAYVGSIGNEPYALWLHTLDSGVAKPLVQADASGRWLAWSPDNRYVLFQADSRLKKVDVNGGGAQSLAQVLALAGVTCNARGDVIFAPDPNSALHRVSLSGGPTTAVTRLDPARRELQHSHPSFLPDGRHFLFLVRTVNADDDAIWVGSLDSAERRQLFASLSPAIYVAPGYLLFLREQNLLAQKFDVSSLRMEGEPFVVAENISFNVGLRRASFSAAADGNLLFHVGGSLIGGQILWTDRTGRAGQPIASGTVYMTVRISPDGKRAAEAVFDIRSSTTDIWIQDFDRGARSRFTFGPGNITDPVWSPDGQWLAFSSSRNGTFDVFRKRASGVGEYEILLKDANTKRPDDWSRDGRYLVYGVLTQSGKRDLWILPLDGDKKPFAFLQSNFNKLHARFSPDGKWLAYDTDESGTIQVYVVSFPDGKTKLQVSTDGGVQPVWTRGGSELIFRPRSLSQNQIMPLMSVAVTPTAGTLHLGTPKELFQIRFFGGPVVSPFDVTSDGQRFLVISAKQDAAVGPFTLYQNWLTAAPK